MRYSLLTRFRGCWLGAMLGGIYSPHNSLQAIRGCRVAVAGAESLIKLGRFEPEEWYMRLSGDPNLGSRDGVSPEEVLVASIPVTLFYHENEIKLRQNLLALVKIWSAELIGQEMLAFGYIISQSLKENIHPATVIPQIISFLGTPSQVTQDLTRVQTCLEQGAGLEIITTELLQLGMFQQNHSVALALYCFLSTTEDYRLSILRAARIEAQTQITATLTGAISGAHNGTVGIPASLQMVLSHSDTALAAWGINITQMLELADRLMAVWSGVYNQPQRVSTLTQIAAIAAPKVIRSTQSRLPPR